MNAFLDENEVVLLTGKRQKAKQVEQLRKMGIAFHINAAGRPVVTKAAVEGKKTSTAERKWGSQVWAASATCT